MLLHLECGWAKEHSRVKMQCKCEYRSSIGMGEDVTQTFQAIIGMTAKNHSVIREPTTSNSLAGLLQITSKDMASNSFSLGWCLTYFLKAMLCQGQILEERLLEAKYKQLCIFFRKHHGRFHNDDVVVRAVYACQYFVLLLQDATNERGLFRRWLQRLLVTN